MPASSGTARFHNNHLVEYSSEDVLGKQYKIRHVVFENEINTDSLQALKQSYIRVKGYLYCGDLLIKEVNVGNTDRTVRVFKYNKSGKVIHD